VSPETVARARGWLEKADHDLLAAETLIRLAANAPLDVVCFHAQQGVEKCLKALLALNSIDFPRTHDLVVLARRLPSTLNPGVEMNELLPLNRYAVEARYPGDWEPITTEEAQEAVELVKRIRDRTAALLGPQGGPHGA
jgi:HEPN domain-containing protein